MFISRIKLKNWKNFRYVDAELSERTFLFGPNGCGKSNLLDVFRFMRDIVKSGGGLQKALQDRGSLKKIKCLSAGKSDKVELEFHFYPSFEKEAPPKWIYCIGFDYEDIPGQQKRTLISKEEVWKDNKPILKRPDKQDKRDDWRLTQTNLEQIGYNLEFREIYKYFNSVRYLHILPQLVRSPGTFTTTISKEDDFYGFHFLEIIAAAGVKTRKERLKKIEEALQIAVPQLKKLTETRDERGIPHLEAIYKHWRQKGAKQQEDQFSDGTIRLIAFLWSILESNSLLLLEEPELSLNASIVRNIPQLLYRINRKNKQQLIISTHSPDLLANEEIGGEEILLLTPTDEGTEIKRSSDIKEIRVLLESGLIPADVIMPYAEPGNIEELRSFE